MDLRLPDQDADAEEESLYRAGGKKRYIENHRDLPCPGAEQGQTGTLCTKHGQADPAPGAVGVERDVFGWYRGYSAQP